MTSIELLPPNTLVPDPPQKPVIRPSFLAVIASCPAALRASQGLESQNSEAATFGTNVHALLAGEKLAEDCTDAEREVAERFAEVRDRAIDDLLPGDGRIQYVEQTIGYDMGQYVLRGTPDLVVIQGERAVIPDYKTGWREQEQSSDNLQQAAYAVLAWLNYGVSDIWVFLVTRRPLEENAPGTYDLPALVAAKAEIDRIVNAALAPDAPFVPSVDTCRYCPAKGTSRCPITSVAVPTLATLDPNAVAYYIDDMPAEKRRDLWALCVLASSVVEKAKDALKAGLARDPNFAPGLALKPGRTDRAVHNAHSAMTALVEAGLIDEVKIRGALSFSVPAAEDIVYRAGKETNKKYTKKDAGAAVESVLGALIEKKQASAVLKFADPEPATLDVSKEIL